MGIGADRVQVTKVESTALGGKDSDNVLGGPVPINPQEDATESAGHYYQDADNRDEEVYAARDGDHQIFRDKVRLTPVELFKLMYGYDVAKLLKEPTGFPNRTDSQMAFSDSSPDRTFQISPVSSSFDYYIAGDKYTKSSLESVQIDDVEGLWLIYYDGAALVATQTPSATFFSDFALCAWIYWDATNKEQVRFGWERHGFMPWVSHRYHHNVDGAAYVEGLSPTDMIVDGDGSLDSHAQIGFESGIIYDEDVDHVIAAISSTANKYVYYKDGLNGYWRLKTPNAFPVVEHVSGRLAFNSWNVVTGWGQTQVPNNRYVLAHVFFDNDGSRGHGAFVQGENWYQNLNAAREGALLELGSIQSEGLPTKEMVWVATFIYLTQTAMTNSPQAAIVSTEDGGEFVDHRLNPTDPKTSQQVSVRLPPKHIDGLVIDRASGGDGVEYESGSVRSNDDTGNIVIPIGGEIDLLTSGVINALDTGTIAADDWYAIWAVAGSNGSGCIASTSFVIPTLPTGYDLYKRRIGAVKTDGSAQVERFYQMDNGRDRITYWDLTRSTVEILNNGNAITWTEVNGSDWLPPGCREGFFVSRFRSTTVGNEARIRREGADPGSVMMRVRAQVADEWVFVSPWRQNISSGRDLEYVCDTVNDDLDIFVYGYVDNV